MNRIVVSAALLMNFGLSVAHADNHRKTARAVLVDNAGNETGSATLTQAKTGVLFHIKVKGLTPGKHGLHLHSRGACETDTGFKSARGHVGKSEGAHGLLNPKGPEPGDLPNMFIGADGTGEMEAFSTRVSLGGSPNNLLDENGSTFIIHEGADDHITQPIGGAGRRIACGVIKAD